MCSQHLSALPVVRNGECSPGSVLEIRDKVMPILPTHQKSAREHSRSERRVPADRSQSTTAEPLTKVPWPEGALPSHQAKDGSFLSSQLRSCSPSSYLHTLTSLCWAVWKREHSDTERNLQVLSVLRTTGHPHHPPKNLYKGK